MSSRHCIENAKDLVVMPIIEEAIHKVIKSIRFVLAKKSQVKVEVLLAIVAILIDVTHAVVI